MASTKTMQANGACRIPRRAAMGALLAWTAAFAPARAAAASVTDIAGRTVELPARVERILLGEGRLLHALALIEGDRPLARIAAWQGDLPFVDPNGYEDLRRRFPEVDRIPVIGREPEGREAALETGMQRPDVAIFGLAARVPGPRGAVARALEGAGVPVVFVDFRAQPVRNTAASMRILGRAVRREANAEAFVAFYRQHLDAVRERIALVREAERPRVFVELLAGVWGGCCHTVGRGNLGELVAAAGGVNVAAARVPDAIGDVPLEAVLAQDPEVYIATGSRAQGGLPMVKAGAGIAPADMAASLRALSLRPGIDATSAVRRGRVHGLWHNFYDAPTHILAIEAMAKWLHPQRLRDLDPQASLDDINRRFLRALPMRGTYWGSAKEGP